MNWAVNNLWLIPVLPLVSAGIISLLKKEHQKVSAYLSILSLAVACVQSVLALAWLLNRYLSGSELRYISNFVWLKFGDVKVELGFVLDPLSSIMLLVVAVVGLLIFVYSVGYMKGDWNFTRFFCFMSLFAGAMLGLVISNSILMLFVFLELVGLASYMLIGFWYHKPSAAAAAKKAFITTRIGDIGLFVGMILLFLWSGSLLFYNNGVGILESKALVSLSGIIVGWGISGITLVGILLFLGAAGKSGQVPLHIWLPDAMEGPTPVSALIHAATMVAAGVYLVARTFPLMAYPSTGDSTTLIVIGWVGSITALLAALMAVAQNDIKRILAYSTISQLGYMMLGLAVGGVAVGIFHLVTHAFFKALLFLGAGSVIHGCKDEQDIRYMGGLRKFMPYTFAVYAVGMMCLAGVPLFSGFWSKDWILHSAGVWKVSKIPYYLALFSAFLTAFYMTRQVCYVFFGEYRGIKKDEKTHSHNGKISGLHESPAVMMVPMIILAILAIAIGFTGTQFLPVFQRFIEGNNFTVESIAYGTMISSTIIALAGIIIGWLLYGKEPVRARAPDPLSTKIGAMYAILENKFYFDEIYNSTVVRFTLSFSNLWDKVDGRFSELINNLFYYLTLMIAWVCRLVDEFVVNSGFNKGCKQLIVGGGLISALRRGKIQPYLYGICIAIVLIVLWIGWGLS